MSTDPLLQSYDLKHLRLRNRVISTAHEPAYSVGGLPLKQYRDYHVEKARGGIAMTMIGGSAVVSRDSAPVFGNLEVWRDDIVSPMRDLADAVHEHGAAVMCQITHLGRRTIWNGGDWLPVLAPSAIREPAHRAMPKAAEDWDLDRIVGDYATAAARCQAGGLDGIEIEAYGHLIDQFWSPATNHRDDAHGGSLDNRLRFTRRVLDAIRAAVGPDFIVGIRLVADEDWDIGLGRDEGLEICQRLVGTGQIDFLNVIKGHIDSDEALSHVIPNMGQRSSPHLDFAGVVRQATRFPVFHAAKISDVATARHAIAEGKLDLVGMTRAHLADPHIMAKVMAGQEERIRPCVGAGYCIDRIYEGGAALCIHNPSTGRETAVPHAIRPGARTGTAMVIGAGPGGLEAARVLAARGHQVTLMEAADRPGGQLVLGAGMRRRSDLRGIIDWRVAECERAGITINCNSWVEADDVLNAAPDIVVVATGGLPSTDFLVDGAELVTSSWDVLSGAVKPGAEVLLYDENGGHAGAQTSEMLAESGAALELVTPERILFPEIGGTNHPVYMAALDRHGVRISMNKRLTGVTRKGNRLAATLYSDYSKCTETRLVDQVVVEAGTLPNDDLYLALKPHSRNLGAVDHDALIGGLPQLLAGNPDGGFQLFRVGDAVAGRNIHAAILDSLRLCMAL